MLRPLLVSLFALAVLGCGARSEVAKEKMLAQVDKLLGEIDVRKKEAEIGIRQTESGLDKLMKGRIEAKVRLTRTSEQLSELDGKIAQADKTLLRLRDHLQSNVQTEINGKVFTVAQMKDMADKVIAARKKLATEAEGVRSSQKRLEGVTTVLEEREREGRERLSRLKQTLEEIDAKSIALKSIQDAANLAGDGDALDFQSVEKQVRDLSTKIDVELAFQKEKWQASIPSDKSLETIVRDTSNASDTVGEIDKILGKK